MMTYMTYNFFFALMTLLPVLIWFAVSLWVILDAEKMPVEAWRLAGESKNVWIALSVLLMWPFGLIFYIFIVRKKVSAFARTINEDALIGKAADRLRKEAHDDRTAYATASESHISDKRDFEVEPRNNEDHDGVFNYEESDARDDFNESEQTIPPKPDYPPTVGNHNHDEDSAVDKTAAYPVIPPRPTHSPRVGNDGAKG